MMLTMERWKKLKAINLEEETILKYLLMQEAILIKIKLSRRKKKKGGCSMPNMLKKLINPQNKIESILKKKQVDPSYYRKMHQNKV